MILDEDCHSLSYGSGRFPARFVRARPYSVGGLAHPTRRDAKFCVSTKPLICEQSPKSAPALLRRASVGSQTRNIVFGVPVPARLTQPSAPRKIGRALLSCRAERSAVETSGCESDVASSQDGSLGRKDSSPGRWTLTQTADTTRSQPEISPLRPLASGRDDKQSA
jgi:hypothetical protein